MNAFTRRAMMVVLGGAVAGAVLTGGWYARRARELHEADRRVCAELDSYRRVVAELRSARAGVAPARAAASAEPNAPAAKPAPPAAKHTAANTGLSLVDRVHARPEYARFIQLDRRRLTWRLYGDLFSQLKPPPERLAQFKRLLDEAGQSEQDARDAAAEQGMSSRDPAHARLLSATRHEAEARIRAFLEPNELAVYEAFKRAEGWTFILAPEFRDFVAERGAPPLSPEQKHALTAAFASATEWIEARREPMLAPAAAHRRLTSRFAERAAEVLSPAQHAVLSEYLEFGHTRGELLARLAYPDRPAGSMIVTVSSGP